MKQYFTNTIIILLVLFVSCNRQLTNENKEVLAEINGKYLYKDDVLKKYPLQFEQSDSAQFVKQYITNWVKNQLLVAEAEKHLSDEEMNIQHELDNYRNKLLIHKYRDKKIQEILKQNITQSQVQQFYTNNQNSFILSSPIAQISYLIFPKEIDIPQNFINQMVKNKDKLNNDTEEFIFGYAKKYDNFDNNWLYIENLLNNTKQQIPNIDHYLKNNTTYTFETETEKHIIIIHNYILSKQIAPVEFVSEQIKAHILNNIKLDFLREIKDSLYNNALKYNTFKVYNH
jgi:hypothetical protein